MIFEILADMAILEDRLDAMFDQFGWIANAGQFQHLG